MDWTNGFGILWVRVKKISTIFRWRLSERSKARSAGAMAKNLQYLIFL